VVARIQAKPGLGPMRFTEDGRWGFVVNTPENAVHVIDIASNRLAHTVTVGKRPYQLAITRAFAYVRSLDSEVVSMIPLSELGKQQIAATTGFGAGTAGPGSAGLGIAIAASMSPALGEAAMMVANPADGNVYYYMEGMVAPMATFRNFGHRPVALEVVNRSLKETEPGVYRTTVRLPAAGKYDVGFQLQSPSVVHCFAAEVAVNPALKRQGPALEIEHMVKDRRVPVGESVKVQFKLIDAESQAPRKGLSDVQVTYHMAAGRARSQAKVTEVGDGVYEAELLLQEAGAYYVYFAVPSANIGIGDLTFLSLIAQKPGDLSPRRRSN
jgi:YVTN family beta-propeller protein